MFNWYKLHSAIILYKLSIQFYKTKPRLEGNETGSFYVMSVSDIMAYRESDKNGRKLLCIIFVRFVYLNPLWELNTQYKNIWIINEKLKFHVFPGLLKKRLLSGKMPVISCRH